MFSRFILRTCLILATLLCAACDDGPLGGRGDAGVVDAGPDDAGPDDAGPDDAGPDDAGPDDAGPRCASDGRPARWTQLRHSVFSGPDYSTNGYLVATLAGDTLLVASAGPGEVVLEWFDRATLAALGTRTVPFPNQTTPYLAWLPMRDRLVLQIGTVTAQPAELYIVPLAPDGGSMQADGGFEARHVVSVRENVYVNRRAVVLAGGEHALALYGTFASSAAQKLGTIVYDRDGALVAGPNLVATRDAGSAYPESLLALPDGGVLAAVVGNGGPGPAEMQVQLLRVDPMSGEAADAGTLDFPYGTTSAKVVPWSGSASGVALAYATIGEEGALQTGYALETREVPLSSDTPVRWYASDAGSGAPWFVVHSSDAGLTWGVAEVQYVSSEQRLARHRIVRGPDAQSEWSLDGEAVTQGPQWQEPLFLDDAMYGPTFIVPTTDSTGGSLYAVRGCQP
jgi:hypothetical protein